MTVRVAAVQQRSTEDVEHNLRTARALVLRAAEAGATLVGLPENFAFLGSDGDHKLAVAETLPEVGGAPSGRPSDGPILSAMRAVASEAGVHLLLGGFPERLRPPGHDRSAAGERIGNTSVLLGPQGEILATYRKIHLFDVEVPGGQRFKESEHVEPGLKPVVAALPWGGLGLSICYDLRFPELYRQLVMHGARAIAVPSAFTLQTGKDHWHVLLRARAIENQVFVIAPAQQGFHGGNRHSYGHALVVDPWGCVLAECGDHEGFALAELDLVYQDEVRRKLPCLQHRALS